MKILWSPLAIDNLTAITEFFAKDRPAAAEKWIDNIFSQVKKLENFPQSGRMVSEVNLQEIREILSGNYRIIYRLAENQISILTVRHGSQLLPEEELM